MTDATTQPNIITPRTVAELEEAAPRLMIYGPTGAKQWYKTHCPCSDRHNRGDADPSMLMIDDDRGYIYFFCQTQGCDRNEINGKLIDNYGVNLFVNRSNQKTDAKEVGSVSDAQSVPAEEREPADAVAPEPKKALRAIEKDFGIDQTELNFPGHALYYYRDEEGRLTGFVYRDYPDPDGEKRCRPISFVGGEPQIRPWKSKKRPLYRLDKLANSDLPALIVEGEKAADAAARLLGDQYAVTTWPGGKTGVKEADWSLLDDRIGERIYIAPDNDQSGEQSMVDAADYLVARGHSPKSIRVIRPPERVPQKWDIADEPDWAAEDAEDWVEEYTEHIGDDGPENLNPHEPEWMIAERFNSRYALVRVDGETKVLEEQLDPMVGGITQTFGSPTGLKTYWDQLPPVMDGVKGDGESPNWTHPADYWRKSRWADRFDGHVFDPGQSPGEAVYEDRRMGRRRKSKLYNKWQGLQVEPKVGAAPGQYLTLAYHVWHNICGENDDQFSYLWSWLAKVVRDPKDGPRTIVALMSEEHGTGKGTIGEVLQRIFGPAFLQGSDSEMITGKFNSHLESRCVMQLDEGIFGGDKATGDRLKSLISEDRIRVEPKGVDSYMAYNSAGKSIIVTTNNRWVLPTQISNRRHVAFEVSPEHAQDKEFFGRLWQELEDNRGIRALLHHWLHEWEIQVDFQDDIPQTRALAEQSDAWETRPQTTVNKLHNRGIRQRLDYLYRRLGTLDR